MDNEHNRYREEEKENETVDNQNDKTEIVEEQPEVVDKNETVLNDDKPQKSEKKKKNKRIEDFDEYHELVNEVAKLKDDLLRNRADLENFKRRSTEERIKERKYALQDFLMDLIEIVDIYDKAVNVQTDDEKLKKFLSGFVMINNRLKKILERYEVKPIDALNKPFDPTFHSAMETIKVDGVESNMVVEVVMTGYTYKDRVLRPSMVKVSE